MAGEAEVATESVESSAGTEGSGVEAASADPVHQSSSPTPDRAALESSVKGKLAAIFGGTPAAADEADGEVADENATDENQEQPGEEKPGDASQEEDEEAAAIEPKPVVKPAVKPNAPTLPAAIVRTLKAYEWTDAEIADAAKQPNFLATATKLHATRTAEIAKWSEIGRQQNAQRAAQSAAKPTADPLAALQALPLVDATKMKRSTFIAAASGYKMIDAIVGPVNATVAAINAIMPIIQQTQQRSQQAELETLNRQVEGFFGGKELEPYTEVYGNAKSVPTPEQIASRNKVLETADALMVGARLQGRELTLGEALTLAHDSVSGSFKAKAARQVLTGQLKTREKALSLRPTSRSPQTPAGSNADGVKTRPQLEAATRQRLASVFKR